MTDVAGVERGRASGASPAGGPGGGPTAEAHLDRELGELHARRTEWARLPVAEKIVLLRRTRGRIAEVADDWVRAGAHAKGLDPDSPLAVEEWLTGPWALLFAINRYIETLEDVAAGRTPRLPQHAMRTRPDGQLVVRVFPQSAYDRIILGGVSAEVWMELGVTAETLPSTMAVFYREREPDGAVALVLGAGNIASIAPLDVLDKLLVEGHVALLKLNPVNDYLGPILARAFEPLVERGWVRIVYGGAQVGEYLCLHPLVEEIHVTGSEATYDAILFGSGEEGRERKRRGEPRLTKRLTGELGNVSPTIVVPGRWSDADLRFHAANVATQKLLNAGFNCVATQVLVLSKDWPQADAFLGYVRDAIRQAPSRSSYYPGSAERTRRLASSYASGEVWEYGTGVRAIAAGIGADAPHELFESEAFGAVLAETRLPGRDAHTFLGAAVRFANERLRGTLGANVIVHPHTERRLGPAFGDAIAQLRYGGIGINIWSAAGFLMALGTWGAFPGHTPQDIQSGVGVVHNARMFSRPQRTVVRGPFQPFPRGLARGDFSLLPLPPWYLTHRRAHEVGRRLTRFEADPSVWKIAGIVAAALRG
jgi:aldehyde dehydrogenase (NAD(P)+)